MSFAGCAPWWVTTRASEWVCSRGCPGLETVSTEASGSRAMSTPTCTTATSSPGSPNAPSRYRSPRRSSSAIAGRGSSRWATSCRTTGLSTTSSPTSTSARRGWSTATCSTSPAWVSSTWCWPSPPSSTSGATRSRETPVRPCEAVHALRALLAPGGRLVMTVPVGYHLGLDAALRDGDLGAVGLRAMRRERLGPHWREVPVQSTWGASYDFLLYSARAVVVAEFDPARSASAGATDGPFPELVRPSRVNRIRRHDQPAARARGAGSRAGGRLRARASGAADAAVFGCAVLPLQLPFDLARPPRRRSRRDRGLRSPGLVRAPPAGAGAGASGPSCWPCCCWWFR